MFAPFCSACRHRVLLGPGRIVAFASRGGGDHAVTLRCWCGELVGWDERAPEDGAGLGEVEARRLSA